MVELPSSNEKNKHTNLQTNYSEKEMNENVMHRTSSLPNHLGNIMSLSKTFFSNLVKV